MDDPLQGPTAELIGIFVCVTVGAVFDALHTALTALGEARLRALREGEGGNARTAARVLAESSTMQARYRAGAVVCVGAASGIAAHFAYTRFGVAAAILAVAAVSLVASAIGEVAANLTKRRASRVALPFLRFSRPLEWAMIPFAVPLVVLTRLADRMFPPRPEDDPERITELEVEHMIEQGEESGSIAEEHAELLLSVLEFKDTVTREVMVPRTQVVAIEKNAPIETIYPLIVEKGHSRYPVYRDRLDQIEGVLYAKDLFRVVQQRGMADVKLAQLVRKPAFFVAESQKIGGLLREMQARRVHLAIVVDEFGGTSGIVTLEDIIEEIVGEIRDEHDVDDTPIQQLAPDHYLADARISIYDLEEVLGEELPEFEGDYESLGGLLVEIAGKVPEKEQTVRAGAFEFIVRDADEKHVTQVEIVRVPPDAEKAAE